MAKVRLSESEFRNIVKKIINEDVSARSKHQPFDTRIEFDDNVYITRNKQSKPLSQGAIDNAVKYNKITEKDVRKIVEKTILEYYDTYDQYVADEYVPEEETATSIITTDKGNDFSVIGNLESSRDGDNIYWNVIDKKIVPGSYNTNVEEDVVKYFNENGDWIDDILSQELDTPELDNEAPDYINGMDR